MKVKYSDSLLRKIRDLIENSNDLVVLPSEYAGLASYSQINRVLNQLVKEKSLVRIGKGVYAKSYKSKYTDIPLLEGDFGICCREALTKLNVAWEPSTYEREYNEGKTTQVPMNDMVRLKSRARRVFQYNGKKFSYEGNVNAR